MLSGVGGRTIQEAKANMSYEEALQWQSYFKLRGPGNLGLRLEQGFALLAVKFGGGKMKDYLKYTLNKNHEVLENEQKNEQTLFLKEMGLDYKKTNKSIDKFKNIRIKRSSKTNNDDDENKGEENE